MVISFIDTVVFKMKIITLNKALEIIDAVITKDLEQLQVIPTLDAPSTYKELLASYNEDPRSLKVFSGNNADGLFSPELNLKFRAWHDLGHLTYKLDFTYKNEFKLGLIQARGMFDSAYILTGDSELADACYQIIYEEIIGQLSYYMINKSYIDNQKEFMFKQLGVN